MADPNSEDEIEGMDLFSMVKRFGKVFGCFLFGYLVGHWGLSNWWLTVAAFAMVIREKHRLTHQGRAELVRALAADEKAVIERSVKDLPSWVYFPDTERAEWVNKILKQMWPFLGEYIKNLLKTQIEQNIEDIMPDYCKGFRFEKIDLGNTPLRLGSVKCYDENTSRDEIILDLELIYAGNCDIQVKVKGLSAGIKDFQLYGILRVELKPLIKDSPLIACVSFYFLNNPVIELNFTNMADILDFPGLSEFLRKAIKEQIAKIMVLPNKYVQPLVEDFKSQSIKFIQPIGVLRLEVIEARHLKKADVGMLGLGKSDPYVNIIIGNQEFRTKTIYNTVNPKWNFICETLAFFSTQAIDLEVMDEDQGSKDDFLGKATFPVETVIKEGIVDAWVNLKETKTGKIHIKATWIAVDHEMENLTLQVKESEEVRKKYQDECKGNGPPSLPMGSVACLIVYLDCAKNLPLSTKSIGDPSPQVIFALKKHVQKSIVKNFTSNPIWEENFVFLLDEFNPHDELLIEIMDTKSNQKIGDTSVRLQSLIELKEMTHSDPLLVRRYNHNFDLHTTISLWFLKSPNTRQVKLVRDDTVESDDTDNIPTMEDLIKGTVEPFARFSGIQGDIIELSQHKRHNYSNGASEEPAPRASEPNSFISHLESKHAYPMLEVSINRLPMENRLEIIVHKAINLRKQPNNKLPDPYVKLYTVPEKLKSIKEKRNKSVTIRNSCNPVFEESFYFDLDENVESIKFVVMTASNSSIFKKTKTTLGFVEIFFDENLNKKSSFTKWYELEQQDD